MTQTVRFPTKLVNVDNRSNNDKNITFTKLNGHTSAHMPSSEKVKYLYIFSALLRYNWHITLCKFKVYNTIFKCILQNDYHNKVN